jgi:hypothetical protein
VSGADQALAHRGLGDEECAGDLRGGEPSEGAQRERYASVERKRRVAAREDQPEPVVRNIAGFARRIEPLIDP